MAETMYTPTSTPTPVQTGSVSPFVGMRPRDLISAVISGVMVGVVTVGVALLMNQYVFGAVLCREGAASGCAQAPLYATIVAVVIGGIVGTVALARLRVYRPLLVVLAAAIALWSLNFWLFNVAWYWGLLIAGVLYGLSYGAFSWLARVRSFILSLVLTVVLLVALRLLISG